MMHPALSYLVRTRLRNRVGRWLGTLKTLRGLVGALVIALVVVGAFFIGDWGNVPTPQRQSIFTVLLGFLLWSGILSGLGQRGLVYTPADLDFLFPGPFARRHLVVYQFTTQYLAAAIMSLVYLLVFGGRFLPYPGWFCLGAFLCQVTSAHLATAAAEASMLVADRFFVKLRRVTVALLIIVTISAMALVVAGIAGWGDVPAQLERAMSGDVLQVLLFPATQASELGGAAEWSARLGALGALALCVVASFVLVLWIPADVVEGSFTASRRVQKRMEQVRRGVVTVVKDARSAPMPRARWFQGAGAVFWLNGLTLMRQKRAILGGLFLVVMIFAVVGVRGSSGQANGLGQTLLALLAMVPLWMHLPVGFRLPRDQLSGLRQLPMSPARIAAALLAVPTLVPVALQAFGLLFLVVAGLLPVLTAALALPAFVAASATLLTVEGMFVLRKPHANAVNIVQAMAQLVTQMLTLMPGLVVLLLVRESTGSLEIGILAAATAQSVIAATLLRSLGRQFQQRELSGTD